MTELKPCPKQYSLSELQAHPYQTAMQMVHERALEIAKWEKEPRYTPNLPEGYRVKKYRGFLALEFWNVVEGWEDSWDEVARIDHSQDIGFTTHNRISDMGAPEHWPALVAFLQGAR